MELHTQPEGLIVPNLGLARLVVRRFLARFGRLAEADDLMQEACIGLIRAARQYDPERGVRFSTYAFRCCWRACVDAVRSGHQRRLIPSPAARSSNGDNSVLDHLCTLEAPPDEHAAAAELWGRMQKLDAQERSILRQRFEHGQTHANGARTVLFARPDPAD